MEKPKTVKKPSFCYSKKNKSQKFKIPVSDDFILRKSSNLNLDLANDIPLNNYQNLTKIFNTLANVGFDYGNPQSGRNCIAYSENEDQVHEKFAEITRKLSIQAAGNNLHLNLEIDPYGNSYAILKGETDREVMICSHLDSVPNGGRFDGVIGIASGLEILRRMAEDGRQPKRTIRVAAFRAEESSVTGHSCLGSSLATGNIKIESLNKIHGILKIPLKEILERRGISEVKLMQMIRKPIIPCDKVDCAIEVHIEQSSLLESLNKPIGIVANGIGGSRRSDLFITSAVDNKESCNTKVVNVKLFGKADHSGGTPMNGEMIMGKELNLRKDTLALMARFLNNLEAPINLVSINVPNGNYNTIPGECSCEFTVSNDFDMDLFERNLLNILSDEMSCEIKTEMKNAVVKINENVARAAMSLISEYETFAMKIAHLSQGLFRGTVGDVISSDGGLRLKFDQRYLDNKIAKKVQKKISGIINRIIRKNNVNIVENNIVTSPAVPLNKSIADLIQKTSCQFYPNLPVMGSMPSHDLAKVIQVNRFRSNGEYIKGAMIFVRSLNGGISHNPHEFSSMEDIARAVELLYETLKKLDFEYV